MSLIRSLIPAPRSGVRAEWDSITIDQYAAMFNFSAFPMVMNPMGSKQEVVSETFVGLVQGAYKTHGIVFACELARLMLFSEARFQFRRRESGRPGELFGTPDLLPLETPWTGATTGDLLTRAMQDADFGGTAFMVRRGAKIRRARPDWVTMVLGSASDPSVNSLDLDADLLGIVYHPGGRNSGETPVPILAEDVAVFAPVPDPLGLFRGIPWLSAVVPQVMSHRAATTHKLKFFENGATPQVIVTLDPTIRDPKKFREWVEVFDQNHKGALNAYRTIYLGAGSQAQVVGAALGQLDFKPIQGADETIIAAAAGVPAIVAGISEGLQGSSLNEGNFGFAMRRFADLTMRPAWRNVAGSLSNIINVPAGAELWYDDRDIPALKDDIMDAAEVQAKEAQSIRTLSDGGYDPKSVVDAVMTGDFRKLVWSGRYSVQLQGSGAAPAPDGQAPQGLVPRVIEIAALHASALPQRSAGEVRCPSCDKLVARSLTPPYDFDCPRCKAQITA